MYVDGCIGLWTAIYSLCRMTIVSVSENLFRHPLHAEIFPTIKLTVKRSWPLHYYLLAFPTQLSFSIVSSQANTPITGLLTSKYGNAYHHTKMKCLKLHQGQRMAYFNVTVLENMPLSMPQKTLIFQEFGITCQSILWVLFTVFVHVLLTLCLGSLTCLPYSFYGLRISLSGWQSCCLCILFELCWFCCICFLSIGVASVSQPCIWQTRGHVTTYATSTVLIEKCPWSLMLHTTCIAIHVLLYIDEFLYCQQ